ncbi:calcium/sodium antiporter [Hyphococcus luteus]|uniref:Sodium:proton exchanger n=1 Tax=Hyphococcus luteus TaxID=2058213 RepID=A0A2S7K0V6_9PROT|nr:calcium/sodium antiporter [Marinicaulis flavus]PQA86150.1 sodium:proton exchanger [Marinicaulis flavus]
MVPEIASQVALVILGLAVLLVAGDLLVRGAVSLAAALKIPALLVSLTIVAFGTSAPELVVTVQAVMSGNDGIALGNIIGSNIANIFLVLGVPALIYPVTTHVLGLRRHVVIMLIATAVFLYAAYGPGEIGLRIGGVLFAGILIYVAYMWIRAATGNAEDPILDEVEEYQAAAGVSLKTIGFLAAGLVGLPLGAHFLVSNGAELAADLGVREELIGLTIVAFGTSLPELATVFAAALHKKSDVAIGGVVGSNIFNLLAVGGAAGLAGTAAFDDASRALDLPVMTFAAIVLSAFVLTRKDIGRLSGLVFTAGYIGFILLLAKNAGAF